MSDIRDVNDADDDGDAAAADNVDDDDDGDGDDGGGVNKFAEYFPRTGHLIYIMSSKISPS